MNKIKQLGFTFDDVLLIPKKNFLDSRSQVDLTTYLTPKIKLKIPIISANMDTVTESKMAIELAKLGGIGIIHRFLSIDNQVEKVKIVKNNKLLVGAAIGVKEDYLERTSALLKAGTDVIVIDIAHGHSQSLIRVLKSIKTRYPKIQIIAGNIATKEAARELIKNGADALKVGIGPGALCTTRIVAGAGVPQLTAIMEVNSVAKLKNIPIIADGGIRNSGDATKALVAGASTVMVGTLLAGCKESPALTFYKNGKKYKLTRGMASVTAHYERMYRDNNFDNTSLKNLKEYSAEGVEAIVPYKGSACEYLNIFICGIKSGFSYCGSKNIKELWKKAEFIQISSNTLVESHPHDVDLI